MLEITAENAISYLCDRVFDPGTPMQVRELGGGVSNVVLLVETPGLRLVLKQSLGKLRVEQDWFSDRERIFRESTALAFLEDALPPGAVPSLLWEDRDNFSFGMKAAPPYAEPWKDQLLRGEIRLEIATAAAKILGAMIAHTEGNLAYAEEFGDQGVFEQLRLEPYYRTTAARHPELRGAFDRLIAESSARRVALVHGDWSPKNLLVACNDVMAIDFEVVHYGDPSYDAAFLLNHLLIKSMYLPHWKSGFCAAAMQFWLSLCEYLPPDWDWFENATLAHLGALLLARVDGKSPVEYVTSDALKEQMRDVGRRLLTHPPSTLAQVFA